jgi:hypothetical protein
MTCYNPTSAFKLGGGLGVEFTQNRRYGKLIEGDIKLPCGQCTGCRLAKSAEWGLRGRHELALHDKACFLTLTYNQEHVPPGGTVVPGHHELFMKRFRRDIEPDRARFLMCAEYGSRFDRPHYHYCIWGYDFSEDRKFHKASGSGVPMYTSDQLTRLWPYGFSMISDLNEKAVAYCARYTMKKQYGAAAADHYTVLDPETGAVFQREPEFARMSTSPGIGLGWLERYAPDLSHGYVVVEGSKRPIPRYYLRKLKQLNPELLDHLQMHRIPNHNDPRFLQMRADSTPERLATRQEHHQLSAERLIRTL